MKNIDSDARFLIDSRTREFIENMEESSYDALLRDVDYDAHGHEGKVDIMMVNTEKRQVEYFNFYLDSVPSGWDLDVPISSEEEAALNHLLNEKSWSYTAHPRRRSRQDIEHEDGLHGDMYHETGADLDTLEQLLEDLNSDRQLDDYRRIEPTNI